jgi:hypothetical protein
MSLLLLSADIIINLASISMEFIQQKTRFSFLGLWLKLSYTYKSLLCLIKLSYPRCYEGTTSAIQFIIGFIKA